MSQVAHAPQTADAHADAHAHHDPNLAHHFDTARQQYDSAKLGMWVFLATEILMFGGLFCAYAIYRGNHPDVFLYAHHFLSTQWGFINTLILIASSFTMAWAVRAAQLNQRSLLCTLLVFTLMGGLGFMVIKTIEYKDKISTYKWVGISNVFHPKFEGSKTPQEAEAHYIHSDAHTEDAHDSAGHAAAAHKTDDSHSAADAHATDTHTTDAHAKDAHTSDSPVKVEVVKPTAPPALATGEHDPLKGADRSNIAPAQVAPAGLNPVVLASSAPQATAHADKAHKTITWDTLSQPEQARVHVFFQIYFLMTGLHGLHVLIGMGLITWVLVRSALGHFSAQYFTPVDLVGLYWHLVDLIWIFLFPLLYLIH